MSEFSIYDSSGRMYSTGCMPRSRAVGSVAPVYAGESCPLVPRDQWTAQAALDGYEYADENQASNNSCCLTSLANAVEWHLAINGRAKVRPDWLKIWRKLTGGRNAGVALQDALEEILANGFPIQGSTDVIRFTEVWDAANLDEFISGIYRGCRGTYGRFIGRGGHAEFLCYMQSKGGKPVPRIRGSWGRGYGEAGYYDVPLKDLERGIGYFGAILFREVAILPADLEGKGDAKA